MHLEKQRIKLSSEKQKELIISAAKKVGSLKSLSKKINVSYSTLKNYSSGKLYLPANVFNGLLVLLNIKKDNISFEYLASNWGQRIGGRHGINAIMKKYPSEIAKWRKLANHNSSLACTKRILIPNLNEKLAEFIGIYLGDGTLTKYFISISGDSRYDLQYFNYISDLIKELFGLSAKIRVDKRGNTLILTVHSVKLCSLLNEYGFKYGDKIRNNSLIPIKIIENPNLAMACLRGLVDTDGCVARHGNKLAIRFYSANPLLLDQVYKVADIFGLFSFRTGNQIGTTSEENVRKYFEIVGSSSLKSIVKFSIKTNRNKFVYQKDLPHYYKEKLFKSIHLPFKIKVLSASG